MAQINKPSDYFNTKLYTGTGATQSITGVGFQPDWVWIKSRNDTGNHNLFDVIRGTGVYLRSNATNADSTDTTSLTSFDTDGFTLGSNTDQDVNKNTINHVAWNWLASNTTASNTDGSITCTVSANTTSGFSIVSYTGNGTAGATIGHGLSSSPSYIVVKDRDNGTYDWFAYHKSLGATKYLRQNATDAEATSSALWNDTEPTSSVFSVGTALGTNTNGNNYIAYCFAEKKGFSKFGSYTGNGNADGTFIYTGFKPAFLIVKPTVTADNWVMFDNKREGYNVDNNLFYANKNFAENTADLIDFTSNGFKQRSSGGTSNRSGEPFIYMCFAESPLVGTNNTPATAR